MRENKPKATTTKERLLRLPEVEAICGIKRSTIRRLELVGRFPRRVKIGARSVGWRETDIREWFSSLQNSELHHG